MAGEGTRRNLSSAFDSPTFGGNGSFKVDKPVGSMSISPCGRDVVLASREGLHVIDLDNPFSPPRQLPHRQTWEVADVQWSPFAARDYWVVSTSGQKALVWNLAMPSPQASIEHILHAHTRAITDINFSAHHLDILATCAVDSYVHCWDLRNPARPAMTFCDWFAGATQVKWNRREDHILASSHHQFLRIWDDRKGSFPLCSIKAHDTKIYGIDWNRTEPNKIVTCSLDKTIKFWNYSLVTDEPEGIISTEFPVWRARHTPMGFGIAAMPQRGNYDLHLYNCGHDETSSKSDSIPLVHRFEGHIDQLKEFLWRSRGAVDDGADSRDFQLVSWGSDRMLRLHHVDEKILKEIGYERGKDIPRKFNVTRKNATYKTFRDVPAEPWIETPEPVSQLSLFPHDDQEPTIARANVGSCMTKLSNPPSVSGRASDFMSAKQGRYGKAMRRQDIDPIAWMKGVKIGNRESASLDQNGQSLLSSNLRTNPLWDHFESLAEEITHIGDKFGKVTFEEINMQNRIVVVSLHGPWGSENSPAFIKTRITFPTDYPDCVAPSMSFEGSIMIDEDVVSRVSSDIRSICDILVSRQTNCLEPMLRYLLGEQNLEDAVAWFKSSHSLSNVNLASDTANSSDEDDEAVGRPGVQSSQMDQSDILGTINSNANVPLPKACGALWADDGRLICFFPPKEDRHLSALSALHFNLEDKYTKKHVQTFENFGQLYSASRTRKKGEPTMQSAESEASDSESSYTSSSSSSVSSKGIGLSRGGFNFSPVWYSETVQSEPKRSVDESQRSTGTAPAMSAMSKSINKISIHDYKHLLPVKASLAKDYMIPSGSLQVCKHNSEAAGNQKNQDLEDIWALVDMIVHDEVPLEKAVPKKNDDSILVAAQRGLLRSRNRDSAIDLSFDIPDHLQAHKTQGCVKWGLHPFGKRILVESLFLHFEQHADTQMLAMLSCAFAQTQVTGDTWRHVSEEDAYLQNNEPSQPQLVSIANSSSQGNDFRPLSYYPSAEVAWSMIQGLEVESVSKNDVKNNISTINSTSSSVGVSASDFNSSYSIRNSPPARRWSSRLSPSHSILKEHTLSASPERHRVSHRSNSNLASALAASISRPFTFSTSASSSPPATDPKKHSSPTESVVGAATGVTWGATSIFGRGSRNTENPRSTFDFSDISAEEDVGKMPNIGVRLKNQGCFDIEGYPDVPLLDPQKEWKYQAYREAYAHFLYMWGMPTKACEVLKYNGGAISSSTFSTFAEDGQEMPISLGRRSPDKQNTSDVKVLGLYLRGSCVNCGVQVSNTNMPSCGICVKKQGLLICIFCTEVIWGLASPCMACGHVIHRSCRIQILEGGYDEGECICGCVCAEHSVVEVEIPSEQALQKAQYTLEDIEELDDAWEDVAYESLARNLGPVGERGKEKRGYPSPRFGP